MNPNDLLFTNSFSVHDEKKHRVQNVLHSDVNRYQKEFISYINIDSKYRDKRYKNPSSYNIYLHKEFKYIKSIQLNSIEFRESPPSINRYNNYLKWTTNYYGVNGIDDNTFVDYSINIPTSHYAMSSFIQMIDKLPTKHDIPEHNITNINGNNLQNTFSKFNLAINSYSKELNFIQRIETYYITKICSYKYQNKLTIYIKNSGLFNNELELPYDINCLNNPDNYPFKPSIEKMPIIITGLSSYFTSIGNVPVTFIENVPFFSKHTTPLKTGENIFNTYTCATISYENDEFIYELYLNDIYNQPINASFSECVEIKNTNFVPNTCIGAKKEVLVGRALSFEINSECENTFASFLGLTTIDKEVYVHTNKNMNNVVINKIPWKINDSGNLFICSDEYIFMRIGTSSKPVGYISDNLTVAKGTSKSMFDKKDNFFFAKIIFSDSNPGNISILSAAGNKLFYNSPLTTLNDLTIDFFDYKGNYLETQQEHSFTLEIIEMREVLKETLIASRTGNVINIGSKSY